MTLRLDAGKLTLAEDGPALPRRRASTRGPATCPASRPQVAVHETADAPFGKTLTVPPISVSLYEIGVR